jgi:selenide,water dikinase
LKTLPRQRLPGVLVGFENSDDAGVFQLTTDIAVVQTVDYFAPIVDDPYLYGQIAAANALSDIYAMGGEPKTALSIVGFPTKDIDPQVLGDIMCGGLDKLTEAKVALLGGHSVRDDEIKFGYAVTGLIDTDQIKQNNGARIGDRVIITKPLGTGLITTALKRDRARSDHVDAAIATMIQLNQSAAQIANKFRIHTMTDVTGFGLVGHASEVAKASRVSIEIDHSKLPLLPGTLEYSLEGFCAGGLTSNEQFFAKDVSIAASVSPAWRNVLFDPQTSGGLLVFCDSSVASSLLQELQVSGVNAVDIGFTSEPKEQLLTVR